MKLHRACTTVEDAVAAARELLAASADRATPYFKRDIHLNLYGNEVVAAALAAWCQRLQASASVASASP